MSESSKNNHKTKKDKINWSVGSLFWGLLFVLIGGLVLADNLGWARVQ